MTDWDRLSEYIEDFFPEPSYSSQDVRDWAQEKVPAWKFMDKDTKDGIVGDWEDFIAPQVEDKIDKAFRGIKFREFGRRFIDRIKRFLGRFF